MMLVIPMLYDENFEFRSFIVHEASTSANCGWYILILLIVAILTLFSRAGLDVFWWRNSDVGDPHCGRQKFQIPVTYCS